MTLLILLGSERLTTGRHVVLELCQRVFGFCQRCFALRLLRLALRHVCRQGFVLRFQLSQTRRHTLAARCVAAHRLLQAGDRVVGGCLLGKGLELLRLQAVDARFQRAHIVFRSGQRCLILRSLAVDLCRFGLAFCQRSRVGLDICAHLCELLAILLCLRRQRRQSLLGVLMPLSEQAQRFFVLLRFTQRIGVCRLRAFHGVTLPR